MAHPYTGHLAGWRRGEPGLQRHSRHFCSNQQQQARAIDIFCASSDHPSNVATTSEIRGNLARPSCDCHDLEGHSVTSLLNSAEDKAPCGCCLVWFGFSLHSSCLHFGWCLIDSIGFGFGHGPSKWVASWFKAWFKSEWCQTRLYILKLRREIEQQTAR